ncbi:NADAR family protein [Achromobacter sp. UBA2119]|uniref:NADAR family protein n=1 Tax=Achromobacter sp. UBA2119 TaxID=1945911 RepID=UPI00257B2A3A|nr:NADAR family protein [Achromobacter sp. UBA2119]
MTDTRYIEDLRRRYNAGAKLKFVNFWGHQPAKHGITASCFSQWYGAPFEIEGQRYPTAEHYMMAEKARLFGDEATRALVFAAPNPGAAKALGRQVMGFNDETWLANRYAIVVRANEAKFGQNPELREFLLQTGNRVLVEASPVDRIWGVGMAQDAEHIANPNLWRGLNLLGFALMQVRDTLRA